MGDPLPPLACQRSLWMPPGFRGKKVRDELKMKRKCFEKQSKFEYSTDDNSSSTEKMFGTLESKANTNQGILYQDINKPNLLLRNNSAVYCPNPNKKVFGKNVSIEEEIKNDDKIHSVSAKDELTKMDGNKIEKSSGCTNLLGLYFDKQLANTALCAVAHNRGIKNCQ